MSKAVLMSIRPKLVVKIASGEKTIEVRKSAPKLETPFKVYIYATQWLDGRISSNYNDPLTTEQIKRLGEKKRRELYNAMGFPHDYIIDTDDLGRPISRANQVARCGNAVCPPLAKAVVEANLPEMCGR